MDSPSTGPALRVTRAASGSASRWRGTALAAVGAVFFVGCLVGAVYVAREYLAFPPAPRRATVEEARPGEWVWLTEATLDCASARTTGKSTYILGHGAAGGAFVAMYSGRATCTSRPGLSGVLNGLNPRLAATLHDVGLELPDGRVPVLCTYCGPANSRMGVVVLLAMAGAGAILVWAGLKTRRGAVPEPRRSNPLVR